MFARSWMVASAMGVVLATGCGPGKLDLQESYKLADGAQILKLDAQPKPQTLRVQFESSNSPITVLVARASDLKKDEDADVIMPKDALGFKKDEQSGELAVEVPANTATWVILRNPRKETTVKVHLTNQ